MKKILLLLLIVFVNVQGNAQSWAPIGATWTWGMAEPFSSHKYYQRFIVRSDTIVNGKNCKLIREEGRERPQDMKFITYQDSNIVYWYRGNSFSILYDFNKNKGESWTIQNDTCSMKVTVDSTGMETINGKALKTLYISSAHPDFKGKTIQYIGNLMNPFPVFWTLGNCKRSWADVLYIDGLRCYQDDEIGFYSTGAAPSCDYVGIEEEQKKSALKLFPNPAQNVIYLQANTLKTSTYRIYNAPGQLVKQGKIYPEMAEIYVNSLPNGLYIFEAKDGYSVQRQKFMILK